MSNLPTLEEFRRQQEVLLREGMIDQATFDRRMELAKQKLAGAGTLSPRGESNARTQRGSGQSDAGRRPDNSRFMSAPYRFVPIADGWVKCDPSSIPELNIPSPEGWVAEIEIEIEAESPLLIGEGIGTGEAKNGDVAPMTLHGRRNTHDWVIPGSTLRGWLRSEMEIVAFARLDQYNRNRVFGLRDFDHLAFGEGHYPVGSVGDVKAGWLRRREDGGHEIATCANWWVFKAAKLTGRSIDLRPGDDLTKKKMLDKYRRVGMTRAAARQQDPNERKGLVLDLASALRKQTFDMIPVGEINKKPSLEPHPIINGKITGQRGHFVFSGPAPDDKKRLEYWFDGSDWDDEKQWGSFEWRKLTDDQWRRFEDINASFVGDRPKPQGSYEELEPTLGEGLPIPIFYVGDPGVAYGDEAPGAARFAFGLTRLFKVPHTYSLGDVVARSNHERPRLPAPVHRENGPRIPIDFVENLFGFVHEPEGWLEPVEPTDADGDPTETAEMLYRPVSQNAPPHDFARRGRIAVGAARLVDNMSVNALTPTDTVMSAAKPSFAPFYLVGTYKDYSDPKAKIAGRKVYLPRFDAAAVDEGRTSAEVARLLKRQVEAIRRASPPDKPFNPKILTKLAFLDPGRKGTHPRFRARIRLHNVSAEEIGAVLWVLTHGGESGRRHMIGRAKGFGAGQVKVTVTDLALEANDPRHEARYDLGGAIETKIAIFRDAFAAHMEKAVTRMEGRSISAWRKSSMIEGWLAARDPAEGARQADDGRLDTMPLKGFGPNDKSFNPYKLIRDMAKPKKDGSPSAGRRNFLDFGPG